MKSTLCPLAFAASLAHGPNKLTYCTRVAQEKIVTSAAHFWIGAEFRRHLAWCDEEPLCGRLTRGRHGLCSAGVVPGGNRGGSHSQKRLSCSSLDVVVWVVDGRLHQTQALLHKHSVPCWCGHKRQDIFYTCGFWPRPKQLFGATCAHRRHSTRALAFQRTFYH